MNPFQSLREYERFVYTIQQRVPGILRSTLVVAQHMPPDIKHHRVPAPGLSFAAPNLSLS